MAVFFNMKKPNILLASVMGVVVLMLAIACGSAQPTATALPPTPAPAATATPMAMSTATPVAMSTPTSASTPMAMQPKQGGTLVFPLTISIDAPDPAFSVLTGTRVVMPAIYGFLVRLSPDGSVQPDLAQSWDISTDGKTITFHLRPGVTFQDGTPLDAQAVKWNYDRFLDPTVGSPRRKELSPPLDSVTVVDNETVQFNLSTPFRPLLAILTQQAGMMVSPTAVQKYKSYSDRNGDFGKHPVGAGPFKLDSWVPGTSFTFSKFDNYWEQGKPYLSGIDMPIIGDTQIQLAMLRTGQADVIQRMDAQSVPLVENNPKLEVISLKGVSTESIFFRISVKPWDNKTLRQAIAYAVDRQAVGTSVFAGRGSVAQSVVGPAIGSTWFDSTLNAYTRDVAKAKSLLAQAGYANGFTFTAPCRTSGIDGDSCQVVQSSLADAGIKMNIQPYENVTYFSDFVANKMDGPLISFWSARPDPGMLLRLLYASSGSQNYWGYSNPQVDQLLNQADGEYDVSKAKALYDQVQTVVAEDAPTIYMWAFNADFGVNRSVMNFNTYVDGIPRFTDLWLNK